MNSSAKSHELNNGGLSRRAAAGAQTKKKLIESACLLLAREGLPGLNAAALAKEAGVSKGALVAGVDFGRDILHRHIDVIKICWWCPL